MKRLLFTILLPLLVGWPSVNMGNGVPAAGGGGGGDIAIEETAIVVDDTDPETLDVTFAAVTAGEYIVVVGCFDVGASSPAVSGYTTIDATAPGSGVPTLAAFYLVATGGETSATMTWTGTQSGVLSAVIVSGASGVDATVVRTEETVGGSGSPIDTAELNHDAADLVFAVGCQDGNSSDPWEDASPSDVCDSGGFTESTDCISDHTAGGGGTNLVIGWDITSPADPYPSVSFAPTGAASDQYSTLTFALAD